LKGVPLIARLGLSPCCSRISVSEKLLLWHRCFMACEDAMTQRPSIRLNPRCCRISLTC